MKKDNRGFSLIELIIVLAILAILTLSVSYGVGILMDKPAKQCAIKLESYITDCRVTTMGKLNAVLYLYMDGDRLMVKKVIDTSGTEHSETVTELGSGIAVSYRVSGDAAGSYRTLGDASNPLVISFNRSSGAFMPLDVMGSAFVGKYCLEIKVEVPGNDKVKLLKLSYLTGKVVLEE